MTENGIKTKGDEGTMASVVITSPGTVAFPIRRGELIPCETRARHETGQSGYRYAHLMYRIVFLGS